MEELEILETIMECNGKSNVSEADRFLAKTIYAKLNCVNDTENELRDLLTPDFINTLKKTIVYVGWDVDMYETRGFYEILCEIRNIECDLEEIT